MRDISRTKTDNKFFRPPPTHSSSSAYCIYQYHSLSHSRRLSKTQRLHAVSVISCPTPVFYRNQCSQTGKVGIEFRPWSTNPTWGSGRPIHIRKAVIRPATAMPHVQLHIRRVRKPHRNASNKVPPTLCLQDRHGKLAMHGGRRRANGG